MLVIWQILIEFLFRLTCGIAVSLATTSSRDVTSGFFRVHLWVLMGIQTFAALAVRSAQAGSAESSISTGQFWLAAAAAIISYLGAVIWMYEARGAGKLAIVLVALCSLLGCTLPLFQRQMLTPYLIADRVTGSLTLGTIITAMLLGHWYLNTPTMKLVPLKRLLLFCAAAIVARMLFCGLGGYLEVERLAGAGGVTNSWLVLLTLRWLAGLVSTLFLIWLTWQTLKIPNTQSATGILYAGVILVFIGELTGQLLSARDGYPI